MIFVNSGDNSCVFVVVFLANSVLPLIHPFSFDGEVNSGDSVQLTCHVSKGDLPLKIYWSHNDLPIFSHMGIMANKIGDRISLLTVESVKAENSGLYTCIGSNNAGKSNYSTELFVNGDFPIFVKNLTFLIFII